MSVVAITVELLRSLPSPTDKAQEYYWDTTTQGFGVVVGRNGSKSFVARARGPEGHQKQRICSIEDRSIDDARGEAGKIIQQIRSGAKPKRTDGRGRPIVSTEKQPVAIRVIAVYADGSKRLISERKIDKPSTGTEPF